MSRGHMCSWPRPIRQCASAPETSHPALSVRRSAERYDPYVRASRKTSTPAPRHSRLKRRPPTGRPPRVQPARLHVHSILAWADAHRRRRGRWPHRDSGEIPECPWTTWRQVDRALQDGFRGLRDGSSLALLLAKHRGARNRRSLPRLSVGQILRGADQHHAMTGSWPNEYSGVIIGASGENWWNISESLRSGGRGLPGGSSLPKLLAARRGVRNRGQLPRLSVRRVLRWADAHRVRTGRWPTPQSGPIAGTNGETWRSVDNALVRGARGLPSGTSLPRLLAKHRRYRNVANLPRLSIKQILRWAKRYSAQHGRWPTIKSGRVAGTSETWARIDDALRRGFRGLPGGSSLARVLGRGYLRRPVVARRRIR